MAWPPNRALTSLELKQQDHNEIRPKLLTRDIKLIVTSKKRCWPVAVDSERLASRLPLGWKIETWREPMPR